MKKETRVDTRNFDNYMRALAARTGDSLPNIVRVEGATILKSAMSMTPAMKAKTIREKVKQQVMGNMEGDGYAMTVNSRKNKGRVWFGDKASNNWKLVGYWGGGKRLSGLSQTRRLPDEEWKKANELWKGGMKRVSTRTKKALKSRGMAKKSWLELIQMVLAGTGSTPDTIAPRGRVIPSWVKSARPRVAVAGLTSIAEIRGKGDYRLFVNNYSKVAIGAKGASKLNSAIIKRRKFFQRAMDKNLFDDASFAAKYYPGIKATRK